MASGSKHHTWRDLWDKTHQPSWMGSKTFGGQIMVKVWALASSMGNSVIWFRCQTETGLKAAESYDIWVLLATTILSQAWGWVHQKYQIFPNSLGNSEWTSLAIPTPPLAPPGCFHNPKTKASTLDTAGISRACFFASCWLLHNLVVIFAAFSWAWP